MSYRIRRQLSVDERNALAPHSAVLAHLLFHRGIRTSAEAATFISPDYAAGTHDPFLLKDAEKAAERIIRAIQSGEKIAVYADYDADGIPGAAIFDDFFRRIGFAHFVMYIPHRHDEGFGVNVEAVQSLATLGVTLMITVDCGITDVGPITLARELGIETIITDHHEPPEALPPAVAIIDHKQADCPYPDKQLCGSGVAYKLIQAILKKNRFSMKDGMEKWLLDLVGLATLSDMVPLTGENRIFAHYGLQVLRKSPRKGFMQLLRKLKIVQRHLTEDDLAFMVTPRINAASRMGAPMDAFRLLTAMTDDEAYAAADHLDAINNERKGVVAALVKEVKHTVKERHGSVIPSVIVLGNPAWRPSLLGLAANSCAEEFDRPVFLWGRDGDNAIKGSCRSEGSSNVVAIMRAVPTGIFAQFGGHKHSGGFAVLNDQIHFLEQRLNEAAGEIAKKTQEARNKKQEARSMKHEAGGELQDSGTLKEDENEGGDEENMIDLELKLDDVNERLFGDINKLAPFGVGNRKPVFLFRNVAPDTVRSFGKNGDHAELGFRTSSGTKIPAIAFFGAAAPWMKQVRPHMSIDLIASLEKSMFRGRAELRLRIIDVITGEPTVLV